MTPADDSLKHILDILAGTAPFIGITLAMWLNIRERQGAIDKQLSHLRHLTRLQGRIIAGLQAELRVKVPEWEPGPTLSADMEELRKFDEDTADG